MTPNSTIIQETVICELSTTATRSRSLKRGLQNQKDSGLSIYLIKYKGAGEPNNISIKLRKRYSNTFVWQADPSRRNATLLESFNLEFNIIL